METSIILLIMSIILVAIGIRLMVTLSPRPSSGKEEKGASVTVSGKRAVVTVRNATGGDVKVFFDEPSVQEDDRVIPYSGMEDRNAEEEVTILDELRNPKTPRERKAQIETELLALGYRIVQKPNANPGKGVKPKGQATPEHRPEKKPSSEKPSEPEDGNNNKQDGTDEGLGEQEPRFESYHVQSD